MTHKTHIEDQLIDIIIRVYEAMGKDEAKATHWLLTSHPYFWGKTPYEVVARGDGSRVVAFLEEQI